MAFDPVTRPDPVIDCFETIRGQQLARKPKRFSGISKPVVLYCCDRGPAGPKPRILVCRDGVTLQKVHYDKRAC